jgi:hypothetical protein
LFRLFQPEALGGAELDVGVLVDIAAILAAPRYPAGRRRLLLQIAEHEIDATLHRRPLATEFVEHDTAVSRRSREPKKAFDRRSRSTILALSY